MTDSSRACRLDVEDCPCTERESFCLGLFSIRETCLRFRCSRSLRDFLPELRKSSNRIRCDSEASYGICVVRPFAVDVYLLPNRSTGESSTVEDEVTVAGHSRRRESSLRRRTEKDPNSYRKDNNGNGKAGRAYDLISRQDMSYSSEFD